MAGEFEDTLSYVDEVKFKVVDSSAINTFKNKFTCVHFNIRSVRKHFVEFIEYMKPLIDSLDVIVLSEVNINQHEIHLFPIHGFNVFHALRDNRRGGGVIVYVRDNMQFVKIRSEFNSFEGIEAMLTIDGVKTQLFAVYRPPSNDIGIFLDEIDLLFQNVDENRQILYTGDININLLDNTLNVDKYEILMSSHGMRRCIHSETRVESRLLMFTETCIDHFYVRIQMQSRDLISAIFQTKISDHYIIMLGVEQNLKCVTLENTKIEKKVLNDRKVTNALMNIDWNRISNCEEDDPCALYGKINSVFKRVYDDAEEVRLYHGLNQRNGKPWVTKDIKNLMRDRDKWFRRWKQSKNNIAYRNIYKQLRNNINKELDKSKRNFYKSRFADCQHSVRETWKTINCVIGKKQKNSPDDIISKYMDKDNNDADRIVNGFVNSFSDEVEAIKHDCAIETVVANDDGALQSMFFRKATPKLIRNIISNFNSNKGPGFDRIRMSDIKVVSDQISPIIAQLINKIFKYGIIPDGLKISILRPIFKNGDHTLFNNYRPIAILPSIEKIMERFLADQLIYYMESFNIIDKRQYGFQKNKSTGSLLGDFSELVFNALNKNLHVGVIFIDFSKAFDTLLHSRLLKSLEKIGIRGPLLELFRNYLSGRFVTVKYGNSFSNVNRSSSGVPQGSILGPLLYLVYVNDMLKCVKDCYIFLYADDTVIVAINTLFATVNKMLQIDFLNILRFSHDNGLTINYKKTKVMHIHSPFIPIQKLNIKFHDYACLHRNFRKDCVSRDVLCGCQNYLENTFEHNYLGVIIDGNFKWDKHINSLCRKLKSTLYSVRVLKPYASTDVLITVYYALAESYIRYGILSWGNTTESYLKKVENIQRSIWKVIAGERTCELLTATKLHFYVFIICNYFSSEHKAISQHGYSTRNRLRLQIPSEIYNRYGEQQKNYLVPLFFNKLPQELKELRKWSDIKRSIKKWTLQNDI